MYICNSNAILHINDLLRKEGREVSQANEVSVVYLSEYEGNLTASIKDHVFKNQNQVSFVLYDTIDEQGGVA